MQIRENSDEVPKMTTLDRLRAGVVLARDAVKIGVTAMEALRGVAFIGITEKNELVDVFKTLTHLFGLNNLRKNY